MPPSSTIDRKSLGEYHPNLHDCGVVDRPFTEIRPESWQRALQKGMRVEGNLSPGDHPRVNHRAFLEPVFVKVRLDLLGQDSSSRTGVQHFKGEIKHSYYHEVHGSPMFTVDFIGTIGIRELRVYDTEPEESEEVPTGLGRTQRTLDFGGGSGTSMEHTEDQIACNAISEATPATVNGKELSRTLPTTIAQVCHHRDQPARFWKIHFET